MKKFGDVYKKGGGGDRDSHFPCIDGASSDIEFLGQSRLGEIANSGSSDHAFR